MKNFRLTYKSTMTIALIAVVLLCLIFSCFGIAIAEENAAKDIKVVHITDLHYYPTYLCYKQKNEDYYNSAMVSKSKLESKLIAESSSVLKKLFSDIAGDNETLGKKNSLPDYLVVTGDLSSDGERVALIDIANALRSLQNKIRAKGKENFQIFVIPGNHDISNKNATDYSTLKGAPIEGVNRNDFAKIFAGLGYPDMSFGEAAEYYANDEFDNVNLKYLPYETESRYVPSTNSKNIKFSYMSMNDWNQELGDGDLSYVANCADGNTFVAIDGVVKGEIGGKVNSSVFTWLESIKKDSLTGNIMSLTHHNVLQHFTMQEKWSKDYLFGNWEQVRDYLVQVGVKYNFSGHMHANDIASYCNYDGYNLYDLETGSPVGYGAQYRETNISFLSDGASDLKQKLCTIMDVDLSLLLKDGYLVKNKDISFITGIGIDGTVKDMATYINERLYVDMLDNVLNSTIQMIDRDNFANLLYGYIEKSLTKYNFIKNVIDKDSIKAVLLNLYDKIQSATLKDYIYTGDKEFLQGPNDKLRAYLYNFAQSVINMEIESNYTLQDLFVDSYTTHLKGGEGIYLPANDRLKNAIEWMQSGKFVADLVEKINDSNNGVSKLIKAVLSANYDLTVGLSADKISNINALLTPIRLDNFNLDKLLTKLLKTDDSTSNMIDDKLTYILSDSIAKGIGRNLSDVVYSLVTDVSYDGIAGIESRVVYSENDEHSHYANGNKRPASITDGRLPSMITMTLGKNVYADRNIVWFTDKSITATDLQICEGDRQAFIDGTSPISLLKGKTQIYAVDFPLAELGIVSTYTTKEIARHQINLTGLKANTVYTYRIGDIDNWYWSEIYTFKTADIAEKTPFEILITTDMQAMTKNSYENSSKLLKASLTASKFGYDFMFNLGDIVDDGRNLSQWQNYLDCNGKIFGSLPQVIAPGNHDVAEFVAPQDYVPSQSDVVMSKYQALDLHYNFEGKNNYYSFDYKGVHFVVLDTNNMNLEQIDWLRQDLEANKDNLVVVGMHKGIYSAGPHQNDTDIVNMRKHLSKLFSDNKVEIVLQGHDHIYSESFFLDSEGKKTDTPVYKQGAPINNNNGGVLYVTMGTSGDKFYDFNMNTDDFINKGKMFHSPKLKNPTFGRIVFDGQNISFYSYQYDINNDRIDQLKMFNNNSIWIIVTIVTAVVIGVGMIILVIFLLRNHKRKIEKCKQDNELSLSTIDESE